MLLPLKDYNPLKKISFQFVTVAVIAACVAVFLWHASLPATEARRVVLGLGTIPAVLFGSQELPPELFMVPASLTLLTSMFMHGGFMHLAGNMLFLWVLGDNVEDSMGHGRFLLFYLICGIVAALAHAGIDTASTTPMVGASGAISGVIGAYLILHPKTRILTLVFSFFVYRIPAYVVLGGWAGLQTLNAAIADPSAGGVAWWAHIGGFLTGCLLITMMRDKSVPLFDGVWKPTVPKTFRRKSIIPNSGKKRR